jgi:hypothetical protein
MANRRNQRVLFVLECGGVEADVLSTLPSLAHGGVPEVLGLFIEDEDLLGAAMLPGASEVSLVNLDRGALNPDRIADDLARQARSMQAVFEASAKKFNLRYSFRVSRGRTMDMLVNEAATSDLVVVCRPLRAPGLRSRPGAQFRQLLEHHRNVLFVNEPWRSGTRVLAVCDGVTSSCRYAMHRASDIAKSEALEFVVAHVGENEAVLKLARELGCDHQITIAELNEASLIDLCYSQDARLLVMPPVEGLDWQQLLIGLLDKLSCSLLLLNEAVEPEDA